ncbi:MAG: hypothetical protein EOS64_30070 [Mesorhizobium sp.]|nr:MAG: hypothetical protein EOS64_30070 [Mesorhizobium sp.]
MVMNVGLGADEKARRNKGIARSATQPTVSMTERASSISHIFRSVDLGQDALPSGPDSVRMGYAFSGGMLMFMLTNRHSR